jgi:hypothetical protein
MLPSGSVAVLKFDRRLVKFLGKYDIHLDKLRLIKRQFSLLINSPNVDLTFYLLGAA